MSSDRDTKHSSKENAVYRFDFRITLGPDEKTVMSGLEGYRGRVVDCVSDIGEDYVFQLELGKEGNYHFQGYLKVKTKVRCGTLTHDFLSAWPGHSVHVAPMSRDGEKALTSYVMKKDTHVAGPWGKRKIYTGADLKHQIQFYPWQKDVWAAIAKDPDDRTINWICDPAGNNGKSMLCKKIWFEKQCTALTWSTSANLCNLIYKSPVATIYCFDLSRAKPQDISGNDIYSVMEQLKNGVIVNTKYETGQKLFDPPHVWVMSNYPPKFSALTPDRWKVWTINEQKELVKYETPPELLPPKITADEDTSADDSAAAEELKRLTQG